MRNRITNALALLMLCSGLFCSCQQQLSGAMLQQDKELSSDPKKPQTEGEKKKRALELRNPAYQAFNTAKYDDALAAAKEMRDLQPKVIDHHLFLGDVAFAACDMATSIGAYDDAIKMRSSLSPQLWQRGLALYYAKRFDDGVKQFETHQTVNSQDVENAVWHLLCAARVSDVEKARKKLIPITGDTRVPMSQVYEMFAGRMTPEEVLKAAETSKGLAQPGTPGHRLQLYYAHLYTGLYHEMLQKPELAIASMKKAEEVNPLAKSNFMGVVAHVHLKLRAAESRKDESKKQSPSTKKTGEAKGGSPKDSKSDESESKSSDQQ